MKKEDARLLVIQLWGEWPERNQAPSPAKGLLFFNWLNQSHPYALNFRASGDKWQVISGWMSRHGLR